MTIFSKIKKNDSNINNIYKTLAEHVKRMDTFFEKTNLLNTKEKDNENKLLFLQEDNIEIKNKVNENILNNKKDLTKLFDAVNNLIIKHEEEEAIKKINELANQLLQIESKLNINLLKKEEEIARINKILRTEIISKRANMFTKVINILYYGMTLYVCYIILVK